MRRCFNHHRRRSLLTQQTRPSVCSHARQQTRSRSLLLRLFPHSRRRRDIKPRSRRRVRSSHGRYRRVRRRRNTRTVSLSLSLSLRSPGVVKHARSSIRPTLRRVSPHRAHPRRRCDSRCRSRRRPASHPRRGRDSRRRRTASRRASTPTRIRALHSHSRWWRWRRRTTRAGGVRPGATRG